MQRVFTLAILTLASLGLAGCASMGTEMGGARANTKEIGLLIQSINVSTAKFQQQRNAIAVSSKRQRDALESLAMRNEGDTYRATAAWNVAGQTERKRTFEALREEAGNLLVRLEQQRAREQAQAHELQRMRSAVVFQSAKLSEAAIALIDLAEPPSRKEDAKFFYEYVKEVLQSIKKDSEAAAAAQTQEATKPKDKS